MLGVFCLVLDCLDISSLIKFFIDASTGESKACRAVLHQDDNAQNAFLRGKKIAIILPCSSRSGSIQSLKQDSYEIIIIRFETATCKTVQMPSIMSIVKEKIFYTHVAGRDLDKFAVFVKMASIIFGGSLSRVCVMEEFLRRSVFVLLVWCLLQSFFYQEGGSSSDGLKRFLQSPQTLVESSEAGIHFLKDVLNLAESKSKIIYATAGGKMLQSLHQETKQVTAACWACPVGSKVTVGYNNGDIFIWGVPSTPNLKIESSSDCGTQNSTPICKLNLGYKLEKIPIASLKWVYADGKASRLYVRGGASDLRSYLSKVLLLNEHTESRTIKLALHLSEHCVNMEITSSSSEPSKQKQDSFLLLGNSGHVYAYDDCQIERYLLQYQSRSPPSLPKEVKVKIPFLDSSITAVKLITDSSYMLSSSDEDYSLLAKSIPSLFPSDTKTKDVSQSHSSHLSGFAKVKNLFITGHRDGALNFWDLSCPLFIPLLSLKQQSENDVSLSGIPLTALYFDGNSRILVSGDQSGMVRIFKFKSEQHAAENSFMSFTGTKKGSSYSVKVIKVNGAILSLNINHTSRHLAVGSDQGYASSFFPSFFTFLFIKLIDFTVVSWIISLQFETCNFHGFEKNVLVVATKDSSVLALDSDTGNTMSTNTVHPKKPSRALFMQVLDGQVALARGGNVSNGTEVGKANLAENGVQKQLFALLCSEKAAYIYSLNHVVQGVKKVLYKKRFHSSSCCLASTFYSGSEVGLILLFTSGKIEIRSLPELSLLRETSIRGFTYSPPKPKSLSESLICSSWDGELVMVNGDQEIFFASTLLEKNFFRLLDNVTQVYRKDVTISQEGLASGAMVQKEKKKGLFSSVLKDIKGGKTKQAPDVETEDTRESIEELSTIFSTANFPCDSENTDNLGMEDDENEFNIDDIDLEDMEEKPKEQSMFATLNKQKLSSSFKALKGKFKQTKVKNEKSNTMQEQQDDKTSTVDQIKRRYGFSSSGETSAARIAESKLHENLKKLQDISLRTTEMQDTARSFSSMAKELLKTAENDKRSS
ncbi:hypothetical protein JRO89_XS08G0109400 [Xanthoceras sorbifolium]|uniref:Lethal giant larvae (Lgl)-like C-terminal domain-containing protein n=1 Tax=Xanthoceras sorbifolium TaxID=99658 RepID=A0ABQ8HPA2_9ROSI|nr:hypothetical protein JRO89_XS08G0109400 [Xanthoceras sorbifolium]